MLHSVFLFPTYYTFQTSINDNNTKSHATKQFLMIIRDNSMLLRHDAILCLPAQQITNYIASPPDIWILWPPCAEMAPRLKYNIEKAIHRKPTTLHNTR